MCALGPVGDAGKAVAAGRLRAHAGCLKGGVHQSDFHLAVRAGNLLTEGVRGELHVTFAEIALGFQGAGARIARECPKPLAPAIHVIIDVLLRLSPIARGDRGVIE